MRGSGITATNLPAFTPPVNASVSWISITSASWSLPRTTLAKRCTRTMGHVLVYTNLCGTLYESFLSKAAPKKTRGAVFSSGMFASML